MRRSQYPMVGVVRKNIWAKKGCMTTALDGGQVDIFYTPSTNTLYMVYRRIQQTNNKTHFCNWFLSNLLTPTALYSWGKFPNRSNQQILTLKVLESHRSTLPSHNCLVLLCDNILGTPLSHSSLLGLCGSSDSKVFGESQRAFLIPQEAPGFNLANAKSWSTFFYLGSLCTEIEPNDNIPAQSTCHEQACSVFIPSTYSLKTLDFYSLDFFQTVQILY